MNAAGGKRRNAYWLYDAPLWRDWLAWLTAFAIVAGISGSLASSDTATTPDVIFAIVFQFGLFGVMPGRIRAAIRRRRASSG